MTTLTKSNGAAFGLAAAAVLGVVAVTISAIVWGGFWTGLTLSVLWGWFIAPLFGLPALTVWQAYGVALVASTLRSSKYSKTDESFGEVMAKALVVPPFVTGLTLLIGWGVKAWI